MDMKPKRDRYVQILATSARIAKGLDVVKWIAVGWWLLSGAAAMQTVWTGTDWPAWTLVPIGLASVVGAYVAWLLVGAVQSHVTMTRQIMIHTRPVTGNAVAVGGGAVVASSPGYGSGGSGGSATIVGSGGQAYGGAGGGSGTFRTVATSNSAGGSAGTARADDSATSGPTHA